MEHVFAGRVALVTGGGKGIGLGIASALARRGARVVVSGRHKDLLDSAVSGFATSALALNMDVRDESSVTRGVEEAVGWGGRLDIVVNNAGIGLLQTPLTETTSEAWRDVIDTNLTGAFTVARAVWPHLVASKGQIMNVSSIAGTQGFSGGSAYCASKFGLSGLTEVLKREGAEVGVRALSLCPGPVDTDIWGEWANDQEKSRMMTPDQLAVVAMALLEAPRNIDLSQLVVVNAVSPWT
ncbi:MAG: SDR family oxidoreductase [Armatimonadetes bacterium]|nr:SDR family oxidoreductase [Armatimonadota bacterium]